MVVKRLVGNALVCGTLLWSALKFSFEEKEALRGARSALSRNEAPVLWRFGTPPVLELTRCMDRVRSELARDSIVGFVSAEGPSGDQLFRWRWAAFLAPEIHLLEVHDPVPPLSTAFLVVYGREFRHRQIEPVFESPGCSLFRVRPVS